MAKQEATNPFMNPPWTTQQIIQPSEKLKPWVRYFYAAEFCLPEGVELTVLLTPKIHAGISFHFGEYALCHPNPTLTGHLLKAVYPVITGRSAVIFAALRTGKIQTDFGFDIRSVCMSDTIDMNLLCRDFNFLHEEIQEKDLSRKIELIENYLLKRLSQTKIRPTLSADIVDFLYTQHSSVRLKDICREFHLSERTLERKFTQDIGITPKQFIQVLRFNRAIRMASEKKGSWAQIANELGYSDQAHFIHSFRNFSGETPISYLHNPHIIDRIMNMEEL
ncbi:MAG: helix-turn-helix domain-containing protein [Bacteroidia bacterium]|jgi:AraC-like DNA-binding protein|nr:helix-turn-helix domain-containing protein [Bacteroidia bacterium]